MKPRTINFKSEKRVRANFQPEEKSENILGYSSLMLSSSSYITFLQINVS